MISVTTGRTTVAHRVSTGVDKPTRRAHPAGQITDQRRAALDRHVLIDQQVHDQRFQVHPVARRGARHPGRQCADMLAPTPTADPIHVMLTDPDPDLGQVMFLMGTLNAHLHSPGQIRPAHTVTRRAM
ncbi:MAG: hypothetical protein LC799_33290, partial [Actinobacteria bacterium]|nr:hypothetical protein [Actinomycetota bacterium]